MFYMYGTRSANQNLLNEENTDEKKTIGDNEENTHKYP
jgi:hypothetical protein